MLITHLTLYTLDLWDLAPIQSTFVYKYYTSFFDESRRYLWLFSLKAKGDVVQSFIQFKNMAENQMERKIKVLQSDGEIEFNPFCKNCT